MDDDFYEKLKNLLDANEISEETKHAVIKMLEDDEKRRGRLNTEMDQAL